MGPARAIGGRRHAQKFGDIPVVLDVTRAGPIGSCMFADDDGTMLQHHAVFGRSEGGSAK